MKNDVIPRFQTVENNIGGVILIVARIGEFHRIFFYRRKFCIVFKNFFIVHFAVELTVLVGIQFYYSEIGFVCI
ncbi:hypothetical protein SDC9_55862 [bioreactor metagenome]|uniref:Uncharacterized protein n=1 Tax=bioreactor metagenome TaxID=1076179 RepID=A0A644X097_9ZZZZ